MDMGMGMGMGMDMDMGTLLMTIRKTFWVLKNCGVRLAGLLEEGKKYHFVKL